MRTEKIQTLEENLKVVGKAVNVYDEYLWILKEKERIKEYIDDEKNYDKVEF